ncbi:hypothetical protein QEN19_003616 [Hanseniaspora menglaensis]
MVGINRKILRVLLVVLFMFVAFNLFLLNKTERNEITTKQLSDLITHHNTNTPYKLKDGEFSNSLKMTLDEIKMEDNELLDKASSHLDLTNSNSPIEESKAAIAPSEQEINSNLNKTEAAINEFNNIVKNNPVVMFSKTFCPFSKGLKDLFSNYDIKPTLKIIEFDTYENGAALQEIVKEKTGRSTVPNLIIPAKNLQSLGGFDNFKDLSQENLLKLVNNACDDTCSFTPLNII